MTTHLSEAEAAVLFGGKVPKRHKYGAAPTTVDGIRFDSKAEAAHYGELKLLERAGQISGLELQPRFVLHAANGTKVAVYVADFRFVDRDGRTVIVDVKGCATAAYKLKKRLVEAEYGIEIREVRG